MLSSLPHPLQELPIGSSDALGVPNSEPDPLSGSARNKERSKAHSPARYPAAGRTPRPQSSYPRGPPSFPPHPQSPRPDTCPLRPETLSARTRFSPRQRTRVSCLPKPRAPGCPASDPGPPLTASSRPPSPPAFALPARPTEARSAPQLFPGRGPGPAAAGIPRPEPQRPGGLASPRPQPAQPARVALGTGSAFGPPRSPRRGGGAGVAGTALSRRPHCRPVPGPRARPQVRSLARLLARPPRAAHLLPRRRLCREYVAPAAAAAASAPPLSSRRPR